MKTISLSIILISVSLLNSHSLKAQAFTDLNNKQVLGYSLFGLGFTTIAYTYSGYNDSSNESNQRALFYSIGTGMAVTGLIILISDPKKKTKQKLWTGLNMSKVHSATINQGTQFCKNQNPIKKIDLKP